MSTVGVGQAVALEGRGLGQGQEQGFGQGDDPRVTMNMEVMAALAARRVTGPPIFDQVAEIVCRRVAEFCAIAVLSNGSQTLHPLGLRHRDPEVTAELDSKPDLAWEPRGGLSEKVLAQDTPVLVSGSDWDALARGRPTARKLFERLDLGSGILAPMRAVGRQLGVVGVGRSRTAPPFTVDDVPYIQTLSEEVGFALLVERMREPQSHTSVLRELERSDLSTREYEILELIGEGLTNREIAEQLSLSVRTIEWHRSNLSAKLGLSRRSELVAAARQLAPRAS